METNDMSKRPANVTVDIREVGGDINRLIRKFIKKVKKERIIEDYLNKRFYIKRSDKKRREKITKLQNIRKAEAERKNQIKKKGRQAR